MRQEMVASSSKSQVKTTRAVATDFQQTVVAGKSIKQINPLNWCSLPLKTNISHRKYKLINEIL